MWRTDGTDEGTMLVKDIAPGPKSSKPQDLIAVGDDLFFTADDRTHGRELWRTDGTAVGTVLVKDIVPGKEGSRLGDFSALGDDLYFLVWDDCCELVIPGEQYRSDGTAAGTAPFGPEQDGPDGMQRPWHSGSEQPASVSVGGHIYFGDGSAERGLAAMVDAWPAWVIALVFIAIVLGALTQVRRGGSTALLLGCLAGLVVALTGVWLLLAGGHEIFRAMVLVAAVASGAAMAAGAAARLVAHSASRTSGE